MLGKKAKENDADSTKLEKRPDPVIEKKEVDLVTGANGKIGKELVKALMKKGDIVRALVKRKEQIVELSPGVIPYIGDITNQKELDDAVNGADNVFHLAGAVSEYRYTTEELMHINVDGTRNALDACEKYGIKHFIFSSTIDVYGRKRNELLTEDSERKPSDRYGYSKMLAEDVVERYKNTVPSTILRIATVYGPGFESSFFKIFKALQDQKVYFIGNGKNHLSIIHIYDVLQALLLARMNDKSKNRIYNTSDGTSYTQEYLFDLAADELKAPRPTKHMSEFIVKLVAKSRGLDTDELRFITSDRVIDITRIKTELGFNPMVNIKVGGSELVKAFLAKKH
ncbi:MAG: NAD-dependent epimerase/dehydratase family protein [Candidatus Micrarchaeia archaeon]